MFIYGPSTPVETLNNCFVVVGHTHTHSLHVWGKVKQNLCELKTDQQFWKRWSEFRWKVSYSSTWRKRTSERKYVQYTGKDNTNMGCLARRSCWTSETGLMLTYQAASLIRDIKQPVKFCVKAKSCRNQLSLCKQKFAFGSCRYITLLRRCRSLWSFFPRPAKCNGFAWNTVHLAIVSKNKGRVWEAHTCPCALDAWMKETFTSRMAEWSLYKTALGSFLFKTRTNCKLRQMIMPTLKHRSPS